MNEFTQPLDVNHTIPIGHIQRQAQLEEELDKYLALLVKTYQPEQVWLFGSLATGQVHEWSDIDLLVIKDTDKRFLDRSKELFYLLRPQVGLDLFVYTPHEFEQLLQEQTFVQEEMIGKGKLLYPLSPCPVG